MSDYHQPVLLNESIEGLNLENEGVYVDVTFGGGGHSREILERNATCRLVCFDQDQDAQENLVDLVEDFGKERVTFIDGNFRHLRKYLKAHGIGEVNGVLADLGVSSHQFDQPDRGFSTRFDSDLDMRMDQEGGKTAQDLLNELPEKELIHIFSFYGEIKNSRTLASRICAERAKKEIQTSTELKRIATELAPRNKDFKYLAQVFQALRIVVNDEMSALEEMLDQTGSVIKEGGRLVAISYHSLEDRMIKNYMSKGNVKGTVEKDFYGNLKRPFEPITRKPITPSDEEIKSNNRARSAKLRIAVRKEWR